MRPLKLVITKNSNNTWNKTIIDVFNNEVIFEHSGIPLEFESKEYFDKIENKIKDSYETITEVERFV